MAAGFVIREATSAEADTVGMMVAQLLGELYPDHAEHFPPQRFMATARRLIGDPAYIALLATRGEAGGDYAGVICLNECKAVYADGIFGEVSELYIDPAHRSSGLGAELVAAAIAIAKARNWGLLEVGAPDAPRWQRTIDFYQRCGFVEIGPRLFIDFRPGIPELGRA